MLPARQKNVLLDPVICAMYHRGALRPFLRSSVSPPQPFHQVKQRDYSWQFSIGRVKVIYSEIPWCSVPGFWSLLPGHTRFLALLWR